MTIPPEKRTNAIRTRSRGLVPESTSERLRALVEGVILAAVSLGVYVAVVYPVSVALTPLRGDSLANALVLVVTVVVLSVVYDGLRRVLG